MGTSLFLNFIFSPKMTTNPLAEGWDPKVSVFVTNIDIDVQEAHLKQFFGFCGDLKRLKFLSYTLASPFKACLIEFADESGVETAKVVTETPLLGRPIKVLDVDAAEAPPSEAPVLPPPVVSSGIPGLPPNTMLPPGSSITPVPNAMFPPPPFQAGAGMILPQPPTYIPAPPPPSPFNNKPPEMTNQQTPQEMARTLYVGNIDPSITPEQLTTMFNQCGAVSFCRLTGGQSDNPNRYAFVEFETLSGSQRGLMLNGQVVAGQALRVGHSKNPIVKPPKVEDTRATREAKRRVADRLARINARILGKTKRDEKGDDDDKDAKKARTDDVDSRDRRDRDRRRERRPSRERYSSSSSSRYRDNRDRDRDRDRRDRDKYRSSSSSSRSRRRSRSRDRDRSSRHRDDKDRRRDDDKDRKRDEKRHEDKDRRRDDDKDRKRDEKRDDDVKSNDDKPDADGEAKAVESSNVEQPAESEQVATAAEKPEEENEQQEETK